MHAQTGSNWTRQNASLHGQHDCFQSHKLRQTQNAIAEGGARGRAVASLMTKPMCPKRLCSGKTRGVVGRKQIVRQTEGGQTDLCEAVERRLQAIPVHVKLVVGVLGGRVSIGVPPMVGHKLAVRVLLPGVTEHKHGPIHGQRG
jgi:hypothetical protein